MEALRDSLRYESSDIDWCEPNYVVSAHSAEFFNTISNIPFLIFSPVLIYLFMQYGRHIDRTCHIVWLVMLSIGAFSAYFHSTLSFAGQILDQLSILWVISATAAAWFPRHYLPGVFGRSDKYWKRLIAGATVTITVLGVIYPTINNVALFALAVPITLSLRSISTSSKRVEVREIYFRTFILWFAAVSFWVSDRLQCSMWQHISLPYGHSLWHLLVFSMGTKTCVTFAYLDAWERHAESRPVLAYWPNDSLITKWFGLPYIVLEGKLPFTTTRDLDTTKTNGHQTDVNKNVTLRRPSPQHEQGQVTNGTVSSQRQ